MSSPSRSAIVVGTGTAGSVVARRLVDAGLDVRVLEAGGQDTNPAIHDPSRMGEIWHSLDDWDYFTTPQIHAAERRLHLPRGKVLGGSHALNAMIWVRGDPADYDGWAALGNAGWSWADVLPIFKMIENYSGGASELRATGGLLDVMDDYQLDPIQAAIIEAAVEIGLEHNPDYNGDHLDGISQQQLTVRDGKRLSTYVAYLKPVVGHPNLTLETGCWVHRLLMEGNRVVGVEYEDDNGLHEARADEVILCAGAIDSPRILLRSGIGPAADLEAVGVPSSVDLPGVGANLHDHLIAPVIFEAEKAIEPPRPGVSVTQTHLFWRSHEGLAVPDTQPINFSVPMYSDDMSGPANCFSLMAGIVTPKSRGTLKLSGPDSSDLVLIDLAALQHEDDVASLVASVRQCRQIGRAKALADGYGAVELYPGVEVPDDDAALQEYVRSHAITYHHQVGTCKMGTDEMAVVDPQLRVRGVEGLRVADASIMPTVTTGNTNAPTAMIGEKAAQLILSDPA